MNEYFPNEEIKEMIFSNPNPHSENIEWLLVILFADVYNSCFALIFRWAYVQEDLTISD